MLDADFPKDDPNLTAGFVAVDSLLDVLRTYPRACSAGVIAMAMLSDTLSAEVQMVVKAMVGARAMYRLSTAAYDAAQIVSNEMFSPAAATASLGR